MTKILIVLLTLATTAFGGRPPAGTETLGIAQTISQGGLSIVVPEIGAPFLMTTAMVDAAEGVTDPDLVLTTTVKDPDHPDEPVVVETRRRIGETPREQAKRHLDACDDVRAEIAARNKKTTRGR